MLSNKLDTETLKEVGGGWIHRFDNDIDSGIYVLDDKTAEILDGPFYSIPEAQARARELGQTPSGITAAILEHLRNKNNNQ